MLIMFLGNQNQKILPRTAKNMNLVRPIFIYYYNYIVVKITYLHCYCYCNLLSLVLNISI